MTGRLVINNQQLDLQEGVPFPLNFAISDIKEPNKRKRNFSKTVVLPGTRLNLNFFSSTYDLSLSTVGGTSLAGFDFDPTVRVEAKYYKGSTLVFDGLLQLNQVVINNGNYTFDCTLFSNFIDIYTQLDKVNVNELGWNEYDHALSRNNIELSWQTSVVKDGSPVSNFSGVQPLGFGYYYPLIEYGYDHPSPTQFRTIDMIPVVYVKEVIEKMFALTGVSYLSTLIDSLRFRKLLFGHGGGEIQAVSTAELAARKVSITGNQNNFFETAFTDYRQFSSIGIAKFYASNIFNTFKDTNYTPVVITNGSGQYDRSTGNITIYAAGTYKIVISGIIQSDYDGGAMTYYADYSSIKSIMRVNGSVRTVYRNSSEQKAETKTIDLQTTIEATFEIGDVISFLHFIDSDVRYSTTTIDEVEVLRTTYSNNTPITIQIDSVGKTLVDGNDVSLANYVPSVSCSEFLSSIIKMFNLYVSDPDKNGVIRIEPLDDYYKPTTEFVDWTQKVDHSKPIVIKPASTIEGKFYNFEWSKDTDFDNANYLSIYGTGYGNKSYQVQSTFQTGTKVYSVLFAQTVPVEILDSTIVRPRIVQRDANNVEKPFKGKPRIYFYNGLKPGSWRLTNTTNPLLFTDYVRFPCAHHLDDYLIPTFDLNFGVPELLQYKATIYTTSNLFNQYQEKFIKEITGRDSKIINLYIRLNAVDINELDFSKLIMINSVLFRLNEIVDFDSEIQESTKVELVRIIEGDAPNVGIIEVDYTPEDVDLVSGGGGGDTDADTTFGGLSEDRNSNKLTN
jgi:hypothetical protein